MLEDVFFQDPPRKRFQNFLTEQGLAWSLEPGDLETLVIVDEAGMDEELAERVECMYDELFATDQAVPSAPAPPPVLPDERIPIIFQLPDGRELEARLPRELTERVLTVITPGELAVLAGAAARAALDASAAAP